MKKHIPNILTLCNLLCGCIGLIFAFQGRFELSAYAIWTGAVFDFADGFAARWLKVTSEIGKQLDSLSDMVTFGLLPGFILYHFISEQDGGSLAFAGLLIPLFSALRLAKFNIDTRQSENFIGLPTPANALFISALPLTAAISWAGWLGNAYLLCAIAVLFSWLLVSPLELFGLKFKSFAFGPNKIKYLFLAASALLFVFFGPAALPIIIILYITLSLIKTRPAARPL